VRIIKLFAESGNIRTEIKELKLVKSDSEVLLFFVDMRLSDEDIEKLEKELTNKTGKKCVCLDSRFKDKVYGY